jgi:two-component system, sensor histidine kinase and response regulator
MNDIVDIPKTLRLNDMDKQLFHFIEYFPTAVLLLDERLIIRDANNLAVSIIGNDKKEIIVGKNIIEFVSDVEANRFGKALQKSFESLIPDTTEIILKRPDCSNLIILSMSKCFKDPDTGNKFCILSFIDFTSQKMREEIIRDSETRFKNMANTAPVMIWISDVEGLFSFVNNVWLDYSGGELGSQLGINWLNNVHHQDLQKLINDYQSSLKNKKSFSTEFRFRNKRGKYEWMLIKGKPRYSDENLYMGFIGSCINIHDQKEIEAKMSILNNELVQTIATKDKFFSIISHDLRSPLSGLMGILDILNSSYDKLDDKEKREIISDANVVSKTTYSLMENLLEWSRIQTGIMNYQPERLKIQRLVNNIGSLYDSNLKSKGINFISDIKPDIFVFADKSMTETILRNLISNAIKFSFPGGNITASSEIVDDIVIIKVKDSGIGIDEENIPNLFRVDVSSSTKGTAKEPGTGLGLIICKELAERQKGKIWVESKKNVGSTFYFSLPINKN